jgi:hypothetical protein
MQPFGVVHIIDELATIGRGLLKGLVLLQVHLLLCARFSAKLSALALPLADMLI